MCVRTCVCMCVRVCACVSLATKTRCCCDNKCFVIFFIIKFLSFSLCLLPVFPPYLSLSFSLSLLLLLANIILASISTPYLEQAGGNPEKIRCCDIRTPAATKVRIVQNTCPTKLGGPT